MICIPTLIFYVSVSIIAGMFVFAFFLLRNNHKTIQFHRQYEKELGLYLNEKYGIKNEPENPLNDEEVIF